jgi:hypothetical protein
MCIIVAKHFPDRGWVAVKNRDRNYVPDISFKKTVSGDTELLYFWDDITQYCEGMNSSGVCVLSASLMVADDEKEITVRTKTPSKDGSKIKKALQFTDPKAVAMSLIKQKLPGHTIVLSEDTCLVIEGCWEPGGYEDEKYTYKIRQLKEDEAIARTNHGVWLEWAGYQRDPENENGTLSRISSECRLKIAEQIIEEAESPEDLIDKLSGTYIENPQLNCLRKATDRKMMRTTSQMMLIPKESTMFVRPIQSNMNFNFWDLNQQDNKLWVEVLSNRVLRSHKDKIKWPKMRHDSN